MQAALRALRMILRDITTAALVNPRWRTFSQPVSPEEDLSYYECVATPMDLATLLAKVDGHHYLTPSAYLADVQLIVQVQQKTGLGGF